MSQFIGHFSLWGDFQIEEVTAALGLTPSWVHRKGEVLDGANSPADVSTWDINCPAELSMYEQVEFLLRTLSPSADSPLHSISLPRVRLKSRPSSPSFSIELQT